MSLMFTVFVFFLVVGAVTTIGMKLYVRPKEALERVAGTYEPTDHMPSQFGSTTAMPVA